MLWWAIPALACSPGTVSVDGFEPGLDGAVEVPTDARLILLGNATVLTVTLASEGQAPVPVTLEWMPGVPGEEDRVAIVPSEPLLPLTEYRVDVFEETNPPEESPVPEATATFTTGAGPTALLAPPVIEQLEASAWTTEDWRWPCELASSGYWRELTATVHIDEAPPLSYLLLRSLPDGRWPDLVRPLTAGAQVLVFPQPAAEPEPPTDRDCVEPVILLPNGQELAGEPWCLPPEPPASDSAADTGTGADTGLQAPPRPAPPEKQGYGCGMGSAASSGALGLLMLLGTLRKRGQQASPEGLGPR